MIKQLPFRQKLHVTSARYPFTLLGNSIKRNRFWDPRNEEYFFDRHRTRYSSLLIAVELEQLPKLRQILVNFLPYYVDVTDDLLLITASSAVNYDLMTFSVPSHHLWLFSFESILYVYQSGGIVKRPESVPIDMFIKELMFFEVNLQIICLEL